MPNKNGWPVATKLAGNGLDAGPDWPQPPSPDGSPPSSRGCCRLGVSFARTHAPRGLPDGWGVGLTIGNGRTWAMWVAKSEAMDKHKSLTNLMGRLLFLFSVQTRYCLEKRKNLYGHLLLTCGVRDLCGLLRPFKRKTGLRGPRTFILIELKKYDNFITVSSI